MFETTKTTHFGDCVDAHLTGDDIEMECNEDGGFGPDDGGGFDGYDTGLGLGSDDAVATDEGNNVLVAATSATIEPLHLTTIDFSEHNHDYDGLPGQHCDYRETVGFMAEHERELGDPAVRPHSLGISVCNFILCCYFII